MEHQDKIASCKCQQRSQKIFLEWGQETWCDTFLLSVQCMSLMLPLQPLRDDLSAVRGHLVQMHCKNKLSEIN